MMVDFRRLERESLESRLQGIREVLLEEAEASFTSIKLLGQQDVEPYLHIRAGSEQLIFLFDNLLRLAPGVHLEILEVRENEMEIKLTCNPFDCRAHQGAPTRPLFDDV